MASKDVRDVVPGDQVPFTRTVTQTTRTDTTVTVAFDDGSSQAFTLAGDPALDVLGEGETMTVAPVTPAPVTLA